MHKFRRFVKIAWPIALVLLIGGCATLGPSAQPVSPQAQTGYTHAQALYQSGDFQGATTAFTTLAQTEPAIRNRALLGAAMSERALGQFEKAAALLQQIARHHLNPDQRAQYQVLSAAVALHRGHAAVALKRLNSLPASLPSEVQQQALDVESRAQLANGDRLAAARALVQRISLLAPAARAPDQQRALAILAGMGKAPLQSLYTSLPVGDPVKPYVRQALGLSGATPPRALPELNQPVGTVAQSGSPQGYVMPARVALLLPATGPVAVAGAAVRDGFFTAYFHNPASQPRPVVKVYDTLGTPEGALAAYQQAVTDGATLVVGPLGRAAVAAVFAQTALPIPVLALNHPQNETSAPVGSTEFALLPETEGAQLAKRMIQQGLRAAIVFRAPGDTATRTFNAFKTQFTSLGGTVTSDIVVQQGAVDFVDQIKPALAGSGSQTGIVSLLRPTQARLLLPQLKLAGSTLPQLKLAGSTPPVFSTSMIYSGIPNAVADHDLNGVQFCDEPWLYDAQAGLPDHATLAAQLQTANGPAGRLFAFGMDAYDLMPYLGWLRTHPGSYLPGATGQLTMNIFGYVQRVPIWVTFHDGLAQPIAAGLEAQPAAASSSGP